MLKKCWAHTRYCVLEIYNSGQNEYDTRCLKKKRILLITPMWTLEDIKYDISEI